MLHQEKASDTHEQDGEMGVGLQYLLGLFLISLFMFLVWLVFSN